MNQSEIFRTFMNYTWGEASTAEYVRFSNANIVAESMDAVIIDGRPYSKQDGTDAVDTWHVWMFPDKSQCEILENGGACDDPPEPTAVYDPRIEA